MMDTQTNTPLFKKIGRWLYAWGPMLLWMGLIFYLSSRPTLPTLPKPLWNTLMRKGGHFAVYGILAWFSLRALSWPECPTTRAAWFALVISVLYAASDELHQGFVPGRHPTFRDLLIDSAGAAAVILLREKIRVFLQEQLGLQ